MTRAEAMVHRLSKGIQASAHVLIVVAHPDDEALGLGGSLGLLGNAVIVQLTTGARESDPADYGPRRAAERHAAWNAAGWRQPVIDCAVLDQDVHRHLDALIERVALLASSVKAVWTHPYEGGHPDHDAAAFIVQAACDRRASRGQSVPERLEFASYHWNGSRRVAGAFWPDRSVTEWQVSIGGARLVQKVNALDAYVSQQSVIRWFAPNIERYRIAPRYDFTQPPPTPGCLYERKGWPLSNAALRAAMAQVAA